jgi:hypothetical protein
MWAPRVNNSANHGSVHSSVHTVKHTPWGTGRTVLGGVIFVLHFASAVFLAYAATKCGGSFITHSFAESLVGMGYLVQSEPSLTCSDYRNISCFYAIPAARDVAQQGLEWNVFALLAAFEWISASFALGHLLGQRLSYTPYLCGVWNLAGVLWLMPYTTPLTLLQVGITTLALFVATSVQYYPLGDETVMHYTEYCTSASILFIAVLILYVPSPSSWASIVGFTCILLCNLTGVCAHQCKLDNRVSHPDPAGYYGWFDWGVFKNHFKLHMLQAWMTLAVAVVIIFYLSWDSFSSPDVPWWVRFILINLLVTYTLFGIWASVCYLVADYRDFTWWIGTGLPVGLSILSASAKLPIAFTVFYGLIGMPGEKICSVF